MNEKGLYRDARARKWRMIFLSGPRHYVVIDAYDNIMATCIHEEDAEIIVTDHNRMREYEDLCKKLGNAVRYAKV